MAATASTAPSGPQRSTRAGSEPPPPKHVVTVTTHSDPPVRPPAGSSRNQATRTLPASSASGNSRPTNSAATSTSRGGVSGNSGPGAKPTRAKHLATATSHPELSAQPSASTSSSRTQSTTTATRTFPAGVAPGSSRPSSNVPQTNQAGASGNSTRGGDAARKHITVVTTQPETGTRPSTGSSRNQSTSAASRTLPASGASVSARATTNATQTNPRSGQAAARPAGTESTREGGAGSASGQTTNTAAAGNARHANNEGVSNTVSVSVISRPSATAAGDVVSGSSRPANSAVTVTDAGVSGNSRSANNAARSNRENVPGSNRPVVDRAAATTLQHESATPHVAGRVEHDNTRGATYPRPVSSVSDIMINISDVRQLVDPSRRGQLDALSSQGHENILMRPETLHALQAQPPMAIGHPSDHPNNEALPDILNSHLLPPYAVRPNQHRSARQGANTRPQAARTRTRSSRPRTRHRQPSQTTQLDDEDKTCCGCLGCLHCITVVTQFRWVLLALAMLGVICIVTGIILGAVHMSINTNFLTLSLMFIGLGVMLVIVVGIGWRCTPAGHEPCHLLFNLGEHSLYEYGRRHRAGRRPRDRNQWFGGVLYPEFRYRRPPPSYTASMQDYQHQLMLAQLLDDGRIQLQGDGYALPNSPPPTYRSHVSTVRGGMHITFPPTPQGGEYYPTSRPPTYRSNIGTTDDRSRPALPIHDADNPTGVGVESSGSASSTLHRAQLVVSYLDDVLSAHQSGATSSSEGVVSTSPSSAASGDGVAAETPGGQCADTPL